jgi:hypothetical protein
LKNKEFRFEDYEDRFSVMDTRQFVPRFDLVNVAMQHVNDLDKDDRTRFLARLIRSGIINEETLKAARAYDQNQLEKENALKEKMDLKVAQERNEREKPENRFLTLWHGRHGNPSALEGWVDSQTVKTLTIVRQFITTNADKPSLFHNEIHEALHYIDTKLALQPKEEPRKSILEKLHFK